MSSPAPVERLAWLCERHSDEGRSFEHIVPDRPIAERWLKREFDRIVAAEAQVQNATPDERMMVPVYQYHSSGSDKPYVAFVWQGETWMVSAVPWSIEPPESGEIVS